MDAREIIIRPIITEKSYSAIAHNRYTFEVDKRASKPMIADAVAEVFGVTVTRVNTMRVPGKSRRVRQASGMTRSWKKAVVTLKEGDTIKEFGAVS
jgi:large subunit ribosomal protein L23